MIHARQQIRAAAVAALSGLPTTADRVSSGDPYLLDGDATPAIIVAAPIEADNPNYAGSGEAEIVGRTATLRIIGYAEGEATEDVLDTISAEVEQVLDGSTLGGLVKEIRFATMNKTLSPSGAKRQGEIRIDFLVDYRVERGRPDRIVD